MLRDTRKRWQLAGMTCMLGLALFVNQAAGQAADTTKAKPASEEPKATGSTETDEGRVVKAAPATSTADGKRIAGAKGRTAVPATAGGSQAPAGKGCGGADSLGAGAFTPNPNAVYYCAEPEVTGEPVWSGEWAQFTFKVQNKGTADLNIRVKGG